jgi:hypothetical protein
LGATGGGGGVGLLFALHAGQGRRHGFNLLRGIQDRLGLDVRRVDLPHCMCNLLGLLQVAAGDGPPPLRYQFIYLAFIFLTGFVQELVAARGDRPGLRDIAARPLDRGYLMEVKPSGDFDPYVAILKKTTVDLLMQLLSLPKEPQPDKDKTNKAKKTP